jgi:hypothetical protein
MARSYRTFGLWIAPFFFIPFCILGVISMLKHSLGAAIGAGALYSLPISWWVYSYAWRFPRYFEISHRGLKISFLLRTVNILAEEIVDVQIVPPNVLSSSGRVLGKMGMFPEVLAERSKTLSLVDVYAGKYANLVLLRSRGRRPILFGVDFPREFAELLRKMIINVGEDNAGGS